MTKTLKYAGIGSRETPHAVLQQMYLIAQQLAPNWLLRSGHADGADTAFELGALDAKGELEIFIPWFGFNGAPMNDKRYIRPRATQELADFAASFHPAWHKCSDPAKLLHMRNVCQVLGEHGDDPVDLLICWTRQGYGNGGSGQAIRIARAYNIPVFDLGTPGGHVQVELCKYVEALEAR